MEKLSLSLNEIEYTQKTTGWTRNLQPFWRRTLQRLSEKLRTEERKVVKGKDGTVAYSLGYLEGYQAAVNAPENIAKGIRLRTPRFSKR